MILAPALSEYSPYWETDEFEDLVVSSLIGLYETNIKPEKRGPKNCRFDMELFTRLRSLGCYFPSNDRVCQVTFEEDGETLSSTQHIDPVNDGIPDYAILSSNPGTISEYLWSFYVERVKFLPKGWKAPRPGKIFRVTQIFFGNTQVEGCGTYVVIDKNGLIESCFMPVIISDPNTGRQILHHHRPRMLEGGSEGTKHTRDYYSAWTSNTIQFYQDRRHLWNVRAKEGIAKATFAVHEEQIKSLFYSRELPMTETGRKRPILHWVASHQRRMKSGIDFDVKEHLRGTNEFVYNGTMFEIINPQKESV
jgi:hypothetical protein